MSNKPNIPFLSLEDIALRCADETKAYFQRKSHSSGYCMELFRRAIVEKDQMALEYILNQYRPLVTGWVQKHHGFHTTGEDAEYFVNRAFERMWSVVTTEKFDRFSDLAAILSFLKLCVHSAIIDYIREPRNVELWDNALENATPTVEEVELGRDAETERLAFWQLVSARLHDDKERQVLYGSFMLDLKPQEVFDYYPGSFRDVDEVYRIKQNIILRLRRERFGFEEGPLTTERFEPSIEWFTQKSESPISQPSDSTRIVLTWEGESGLLADQLSPDYLVTVIAPYLKAISDFQAMLDEILKRPRSRVVINSITQHSPISVSLEGAGEAVEVIKNTVVPWRRRHIEQLARLSLAEKELELEIERAEVLERRAKAEKDRQEAERISVEAALKRAETQRIKMENEKLYHDMHSVKIKLALEIIQGITSDLSEEQKIAYAARLLQPLELLVNSDIQISDG